MNGSSKISLLACGIAAFFAVNANASPYVEGGVSAGTLTNGQNYFGQSNASSTHLGYLGSLSFYVPVTSERRFFHFDLGLQNRILSASSSIDGQPLDMGSSELATRLQVGRFYVGAGYAPLTYVTKPDQGITSLHVNSGTRAYFFEGGLIWRLIPELQIALTYSREYELSQNPGSGTPVVAEYGLRFRFPLNPSEYEHAGKVDFDGFRYPFGFMK